MPVLPADPVPECRHLHFYSNLKLVENFFAKCLDRKKQKT